MWTLTSPLPVATLHTLGNEIIECGTQFSSGARSPESGEDENLLVTVHGSHNGRTDLSPKSVMGQQFPGRRMSVLVVLLDRYRYPLTGEHLNEIVDRHDLIVLIRVATHINLPLRSIRPATLRAFAGSAPSRRETGRLHAQLTS